VYIFCRRSVCSADATAWQIQEHQLSDNMDTREVQIFGVKKSADTRKALRFFSERRVRTHFVDLLERSASLGELRRFAQKFGVPALIDRESKRFHELGLAHAILSEERWLTRLADEPLLLRVPLVRSGNRLSIGLAEKDWAAWLEA
jgi:arsenate reductase (glutaredoxin)